MFGWKSKKRKQMESMLKSLVQSADQAVSEMTERKRDIYPEGIVLEGIRKDFLPIGRLCAGDKVRWRSESYRNSNIGKGIDLEVFATVCSPVKHITDNGEREYLDFTVVIEREGTLHEVALDSRRFVKVD